MKTLKTTLILVLCITISYRIFVLEKVCGSPKNKTSAKISLITNQLQIDQIIPDNFQESTFGL